MVSRRPGRAAAKNAAAALKNTSHAFDDGEDELMEDAAPSDPGTPPDDDEDEDGEDGEDGSPPRASQAPSAPPTPATASSFPRRKRLGRPPKVKPAEWDDSDERPRDASETGTPIKKGRGGFRGGNRGGRWKNRGGPSHTTQQPIDKDGNLMDVIDDEVDLPEDEEGEKKVDKLGYLADGREYRCRTFTVNGRGERLYMLSTEPARCVGFRDSYLFFNKHRKLHKIVISEEEKLDFIATKIIPHSYKGRPIGICTARSVFREFGARIIIGGKRVIDDYEVAAARAAGVVEGEIADPSDIIKPGEVYNKNQYVAWFGASSVYHSNAPSVPLATGNKAPEGKKKKLLVNETNWMLEHAREASRFNAQIAFNRRKLLKGVYDPHTNTMQYPKSMQPTHARWEQIDDHAAVPVGEGSLFPPVKPIFSRNYMIVDTLYESAPATNIGVPGPDGELYDLGFSGLASVSDEVRNELPADCRRAFDEALEKERGWKGKWGREEESKCRRAPVVDKGLIM